MAQPKRKQEPKYISAEEAVENINIISVKKKKTLDKPYMTYK
jgi:hypothetical protein